VIVMLAKTVALTVFAIGFTGCTVLGQIQNSPRGTRAAAVGPDYTRRKTDVLVGMMNAVNAGDARRYAASYAEEAVITIFGGGQLRGRAAIARYELELLHQFPGTRFAIYSAWHRGATTVVHYGVNSPTPSGPPTGHEGLVFLKFDSAGQILEENRYLDAITPMAQSGLVSVGPARPAPSLPVRLTTYAAQTVPNELDNVATVRAAIAALGAGDGQAFVASMAPDAEIDELILPQQFVGTRGVQDWMRAWDAAAAGLTFEITTAVAVSEFVLLEAVVRGTLKGPLGAVPPSPTPFQIHRALVVRLKDGKLTQIVSFMNGKELADAVGHWPLSRK
jgi:ketosteroid isomerase-like protein